MLLVRCAPLPYFLRSDSNLDIPRLTASAADTVSWSQYASSIFFDLASSFTPILNGFGLSVLGPRFLPVSSKSPPDENRTDLIIK